LSGESLAEPFSNGKPPKAQGFGRRYQKSEEVDAKAEKLKT
jgi:hypothetical protein